MAVPIWGRGGQETVVTADKTKSLAAECKAHINGRQPGRGASLPTHGLVKTFQNCLQRQKRMSPSADVVYYMTNIRSSALSVSAMTVGRTIDLPVTLYLGNKPQLATAKYRRRMGADCSG
jgi:hypothetical protein